MIDGLKILQFPGRYNYLTTLVGWSRRSGGDRYELLSFRVIVRNGSFDWDGLMRLSAYGPSKKYTLTDAAPEGVVREFLEHEARNVHTAIESAWATECPRPKGWVEP